MTDAPPGVSAESAAGGFQPAEQAAAPNDLPRGRKPRLSPAAKLSAEVCPLKAPQPACDALNGLPRGRKSRLSPAAKLSAEVCPLKAPQATFSQLTRCRPCRG